MAKPKADNATITIEKEEIYSAYSAFSSPCQNTSLQGCNYDVLLYEGKSRLIHIMLAFLWNPKSRASQTLVTSLLCLLLPLVAFTLDPDAEAE